MKNKKKTNGNNVVPITQSKAKIDNSKKEVSIEKLEKETLLKIDNEVSIDINRIGILTYQYEIDKKTLLDEIKEKQKQFNNFVKMLSEKYKIIGKIKGIDYSNNKIILE